MTEREMFKEWLLTAKPHIIYNESDDGFYWSDEVERMWDAWQARAKIDKRNEQVV